MKTNLKIFLEKSKELPTLYEYLVFAEANQPILFACKDQDNKLYLVARHCANNLKCEWILVNTTCDILVDLLSDKMTIREAFISGNTNAYVISYFRETRQTTIQLQSISQINEILPTAGYYMGVEESEFDEEIQELKVLRARLAKQANQKSIRTAPTIYDAVDIARFFLSIDEAREQFTSNLIAKNQRTFYEGNARLNKFLYFAQTVYIAVTNRKLFWNNIYAYDNGPVVLEVQKNFAQLVQEYEIPQLPEEVQEFLRIIFNLYKENTTEMLIEMSHVDTEWGQKHAFFLIDNQIMDVMSCAKEYTEKYKEEIRLFQNLNL